MRSCSLAMPFSSATTDSQALCRLRRDDRGARLRWLLSAPRELHPHAQYFSDAPRLGDTAARRVRRFRVEDFADRSDARLIQMGHEAVEHALRAGPVVRIDLQPRIDERSGEPRPDGPLVIRGIARAEV